MTASCRPGDWASRAPTSIFGSAALLKPSTSTQSHGASSANGVDYRQFSIKRNGVPIITHLHGGNSDFQFDGNPDAQVLGSNPVYVFTNGVVQEGEWLRFMPEDPFELFDNFDDLNPLPLQPGRTWMEIPRNLDDVVAWES